ncbi:MAG: ribonuclease J, partial [Clostridia bacterium]|nr:ribonuclease J [Clostridia bacterium]
PPEKIVRVEYLKNIPDHMVCVMTTGSQGEPMSGLTRMANATHKLNVGAGDTVIISASAIPGNERGVARVINALYEKGAEVVYDRMADVHVSGHACRGELRLMLQIIKPKYFIPVHGEARHLRMHANLANEQGVLPENTFLAHNGAVIELTSHKGVMRETVPAGNVMVDGLIDVEDVVLKDRKVLSVDGLVAAVILLDAETGRLLAPVEIYSRGFINMRENEALIGRASELVYEEAKRFEAADKGEYAAIKNQVKSKLKSFLYTETGRTPMILPIVMEV